MKIMTVVGARPNFMKAAPIQTAIQKYNLNPDSPVGIITHVLVHTGQHYDAAMSDSFFVDLGLPAPRIQLGVGSASHAVQTAEILKKFEAVLLTERPDVVLVVGDVNSTIACALATAKISFDAAGARPLLAHVEAGLRSFDRAMPEEINRILTDHLCDLLFVTEPSALENLNHEGISPERIYFVGNTMIDSVLTCIDKAERSAILQRLNLSRPAEAGADVKSTVAYALLTLHRPSNVDNLEAFREILDGLRELSEHCLIVFPAHPRTLRRLREFGLDIGATEGIGKGILMTAPLGYLDFLCLMKNSTIVVTDSGGIQEETTCLGVPCVTVRENTERPVTIEKGTNVLAGTKKDQIEAAIRFQLSRTISSRMPEKWDGRAGVRIIDALMSVFHERGVPPPAKAGEEAVSLSIGAPESTNRALP